MKNPKADSLRWLEQAKHDLEVAQKNLELLKFYSDALAPPAVPYKSYTEKEATEAVNSARNIIRFVESNIITQ